MPMRSMRISHPASRAHCTNRSRLSRSSSVSARRQTPPLGVAPIRAMRSSESHKRGPFTRNAARVSSVPISAMRTTLRIAHAITEIAALAALHDGARARELDARLVARDELAVARATEQMADFAEPHRVIHLRVAATLHVVVVGFVVGAQRFDIERIVLFPEHLQGHERRDARAIRLARREFATCVHRRAAHRFADHGLRTLHAELALHDLVDRLDDFRFDTAALENAERHAVDVDFLRANFFRAAFVMSLRHAVFSSLRSARRGLCGGLRNCGLRSLRRRPAAQHIDHNPLTVAHLIDRVRRILEIALRVEGDRAGHAFAANRMQHGDDLLRIGGIHLLRGGDQRRGRVIGERRVQFDRRMPARAVLRVEGRTARHAVERTARLQRGHALARRTGELQEGLADEPARAQQRRLNMQLTHAAHERRGFHVDAAEEHQIRALALDFREHAAEVDGLVGHILMIDHGAAVGLHALDELIREASAERGLIVDHGDALRLERLHGVSAGVGAAVVVVAHDAKRGVEALQRVLMARGSRRDLRDAGVVIDARGRHAATGVPVADHANHMTLDELLRDRHSRTRIGLIVGAHELVDHGLAAERGMLRVGVVDGELRAVFQILADPRRCAGERRGQADQHDLFVLGVRAGRESGNGERGERQQQSVLFHERVGVSYTLSQEAGVCYASSES
ncbi:hypothetical protein PT2222_60209 [Paraburkholderia tropica]